MWLLAKPILSGAWAFLRGLPWQLWAGLALLALGLFYGHLRYNAGQADIQTKWDTAKALEVSASEKLQTEQAKVTTVIETKYVDRVRVIRERGKTILKEVPVYVPADSCDLPGGFRLLHDAAATNTLPDPAALADAAPVPAQDVASTVAENYTGCNANAEQIDRWNEWSAKQKALNP